MKQVIITEKQAKKLAKTPSIYDQVKKVNSGVMSMAAGTGMLGENDATDDEFQIACPDGDNYAHINEEAEKVTFDVTAEVIRDPNNFCTFYDKDAYAFAEFEGKMYIGKAQEYHNDIADEINAERTDSYIDNIDFTVRGRFWKRRKYMAFWYINETTLDPGEIRRIVGELNSAVSNREDLKDENFFDYTLFYSRDPNADANDQSRSFLSKDYYAGYKIPIRELLGMGQKETNVPSTKQGISNKDFWRHYEVVAEEALCESIKYKGDATPDGITYIDSNHTSIDVECGDEGSYAFAYVQGKMTLSPECGYHMDLIRSNRGNRDLSICGRFWECDKIIAFWNDYQATMPNGHNLGVKMTPSLMKKIINDLQAECNNRGISVDLNSFDYVYETQDEHGVVYVSPVYEYIGGDTKEDDGIEVPTADQWNSMEYDPMYRMFVAEETSPSSVDLSSFKVQKSLNKNFWKDDKLDSRIRLKLLDIAQDFYDSLDVSWAKPKDIIMTGSLANYNWNKEHSDIDLHILIDFKQVDERVDFVKHYFDAQKNIWNQKHEKLEIKGFPVEVYVQDINEPAVAGGTYSLNKDKWINRPEKEEMTDKGLNKDYIRKQVAQYIDRIEEIEKNYKACKNDSYKARKVSEKSDKLFDEIKNQRKKGLKKDKKEMSNDNIVFKALRRLGYIERLDNMRNLSYDKQMSINEVHMPKITAYHGTPSQLYQIPD